MGKFARTAVCISAAIGLLPAMAALYAAWEHNPQQIFHSATTIHWSTWLLIGFPWWLAGFFAGLACAVLVWIAAWLVKAAWRWLNAGRQVHPNTQPLQSSGSGPRLSRIRRS